MGEGEGGKIWENGIETCEMSCMKRDASPGSKKKKKKIQEVYMLQKQLVRTQKKKKKKRKRGRKHT